MTHIHTINVKVHRSHRSVTAAVVAVLQKVRAPPSVSLKWCSSDSFTLSDIVHCESSSSSPFCPSYGSFAGKSTMARCMTSHILNVDVNFVIGNNRVVPSPRFSGREIHSNNLVRLQTHCQLSQESLTFKTFYATLPTEHFDWTGGVPRVLQFGIISQRLLALRITHRGCNRIIHTK